LAGLVLRVDPITRTAFRDAELIVLRTEASSVAVPPRYRHKVHIGPGLGIAEAVEDTVPPRRPGEPLRLLYAGNLFYLKGMHLGIRALASARARGADVTLTIVGEGPARRDLESIARELGVAADITWRGEVPRQDLLGMYGANHAFLFPSLRDAGGMVILEAWVHGLPVICLALGGPAEMVDATCGRVVPVAGCSEDECVARLGREIAVLAANEPLRLSLGRGAMARCREFSWSRIVADLYTEIEARLHPDESAVADHVARYSFRANAP
jgi:glycosyltransferase involved in cell wall biosynthesis